MTDDLSQCIKDRSSLQGSLKLATRQSEYIKYETRSLRKEINTIDDRISSFNRLTNDLTSQNTNLKLQIEEYERKERYQNSIRSMAVGKSSDKYYPGCIRQPTDNVKLW